MECVRPAGGVGQRPIQEVGVVAALAVDDLGALAPGLASPIDPRCLQIRPDRDCTTGFFICRLSRDDGGDE